MATTETPAQIINTSLGDIEPLRGDPAFAPPADPLKEGGAKERLLLQAGVVRRDIPMIVSATSLTITDVRRSIEDLAAGMFDAPSQVIDVLTGDSRVASGLASRVGGLLGREVAFEVPRKLRDSSAAVECCTAFAENWGTIAPEAFLSELQMWAVMLGLGFGQQPWDLSGEYAIPHPQIWHPRYAWYHWTFRRVIANTLDGTIPIEGGDGTWIQHAPHGVYRGWMRGAMRPIAPWMIARNLALRDAARWSEANGMPMIKAIHPATADRNMVSKFVNSLSRRGGENTVGLPQNVDGNGGNFDVSALEFSGEGFEGFFKLIAACDQEITLTLLAQTLTSTVGPEGRGSYAAARVHADVRQALLEADARALERTIYLQIARPFALLNFGDPDLAPRAIWDITPYEDAKTKVETFAVLTQGINVLRQAGVQIEDIGALAKSFGLNLGKISNITRGAEIYQYDLEFGIATINEARARKGLPPIEGGNQRPVPLGAARLPALDEKAQARIAAVIEENRRLRVALGGSADEIAAEVEALAALADMPSRTHRRASL